MLQKPGSTAHHKFHHRVPILFNSCILYHVTLTNFRTLLHRLFSDPLTSKSNPTCLFSADVLLKPPQILLQLQRRPRHHEDSSASINPPRQSQSSPAHAPAARASSTAVKIPPSLLPANVSPALKPPKGMPTKPASKQDRR